MSKHQALLISYNIITMVASKKILFFCFLLSCIACNHHTEIRKETNGAAQEMSDVALQELDTQDIKEKWKADSTGTLGFRSARVARILIERYGLVGKSINVFEQYFGTPDGVIEFDNVNEGIIYTYELWTESDEDKYPFQRISEDLYISFDRDGNLKPLTNHGRSFIQ